jgi:hypothetical protein
VSVAMLDQCCNGYQCCGGDLSYLLLQINVICMLLFLIGTTAIVKHPDWFGQMPATTQSIALYSDDDGDRK